MHTKLSGGQRGREKGRTTEKELLASNNKHPHRIYVARGKGLLGQRPIPWQYPLQQRRQRSARSGSSDRPTPPKAEAPYSPAIYRK